MLKLFPIRLKETQIIELKRRLPEGQISSKIRELVTIYLDINDTSEERLLELGDKIINIEKEKLIIQKEIETIKAAKEQEIKDKELMFLREDYLKNNPKAIIMYKKNIITTKGFNVLMDKLLFHSKDDLIAFLDTYIKSS